MSYWTGHLPASQIHSPPFAQLCTAGNYISQTPLSDGLWVASGNGRRKWKWKSLSWSDSLRPRGLHSPWNSPGQNTRVGSLSLLQGIFPTQGLNPGLPHCRWIIYQLSHKGNPRILEWVAYPFSRGSSWPRNPTRVSCNGRRDTGKDWRVGGGQSQCVFLSLPTWAELPAVTATSFWLYLLHCGQRVSQPHTLWSQLPLGNPHHGSTTAALAQLLRSANTTSSLVLPSPMNSRHILLLITSGLPYSLLLGISTLFFFNLCNQFKVLKFLWMKSLEWFLRLGPWLTITPGNIKLPISYVGPSRVI